MDTFFLIPKGVCLGADHLTIERVWVISGKNILQTDFEGKKFLQGSTWWKNIFQGVQNWKNKSYTVICQEKILSPGKKILTKTKSPIPPPPPQKSNGRCLKGALAITHLRIFHVFQLFSFRSFFHRVSPFPTVGNSSPNYPQNIVWQQLCIISRKLSVGLYSLGHRFYMFTWGLLGICGPVGVA